MMAPRGAESALGVDSDFLRDNRQNEHPRGKRLICNNRKYPLG